MTDDKYLNELANPTQFTNNIEVENVDSKVLIQYLRTMHLIRKTEQMIAKMVSSGEIHCPCHLAVGQEAIPTGISASLNKYDYIFGNHRSHGHYLALNGDPYQLIAEIYGKANGCSAGFGGSMHLTSLDNGFMGSVPIVAGTIPIATGAALAAKMSSKSQVAVSYFGDGASEEGAFHESLNLAASYKLPILFVCENNLYSSHLDINLRQPSDRIARFAEAHCIPSMTIDGNDVVLIAQSAHKLIHNIRMGDGPAFLELVTYRWLGHVGPDENIDVGVRRSKKDLLSWKRRDPIRRLEGSMLEQGCITRTIIDDIVNEIDISLQEIFDKARAAPFPENSQLLDIVYSR